VLELSFLTNKIKPIKKFVKLFISLYFINADLRDPDFTIKMRYLLARFILVRSIVHLNLHTLIRQSKVSNGFVENLAYLFLSESNKKDNSNSFDIVNATNKVDKVDFNVTLKTFRVFGALTGLSDILKEKGLANTYSLVEWPQSLEASSSVKSYEFLFLSLLNINNTRK